MRWRPLHYPARWPSSLSACSSGNKVDMAQLRPYFPAGPFTLPDKTPKPSMMASWFSMRTVSICTS